MVRIYILEQGSGSIVKVSSGASPGTDPMHIAYSASKAAVSQLTRHMATNHGKNGIRVRPGLV
jgi:NAD(P)-dependent dehydrogenase (short-subunit alcohol dehydrogenase family)